MKRNFLNLIVDAVSLIALLGMVTTGLVIEFVLPPGTGGRGGSTGLALWEWTRHDWGDLHFYCGLGILGLMLLHIALHWAWVCNTIRRLAVGSRAREGTHSRWRRDAYGAAALVVVGGTLTAFWWVASTSVKVRGSAEANPAATAQARIAAPTLEPRPLHADEPVEIDIRGSMSLAEVEKELGIPVAVLRAELRLPASVSAKEQIGRLRREFGFEMEDVREVVKRQRVARG